MPAHAGLSLKTTGFRRRPESSGLIKTFPLERECPLFEVLINSGGIQAEPPCGTRMCRPGIQGLLTLFGNDANH